MRDLYLKAAQMSPEQVDPDIQVCVHVCVSRTSVCMFPCKYCVEVIAEISLCYAGWFRCAVQLVKRV